MKTTADQLAPPLVATIGLHASASTWVFNVVRELMIATSGEAGVLTLYADDPAGIPDETARAGRHLVIKSHHGSAALDAWLAAHQARVLASVRDPRDACVSMSQRFGANLAATTRWIANDCDRLLRLPPPPLLLRYEDRFFELPDTVTRLGHALGLRTTAGQRAAIFDRYRTEDVREFARTLAELPPARITLVNGVPMDTVTQILAPHIGDTRSGKWRDLPDPAQADLTRLFAPFLDRFGYPR